MMTYLVEEKGTTLGPDPQSGNHHYLYHRPSSDTSYLKIQKQLGFSVHDWHLPAREKRASPHISKYPVFYT